MPILRKNDQKVYFAHIPKNAGSSLYTLFLDSGWYMSNFGRPQGPLGTTGTAQEIRDRYSITDLQKEGDFSKVQTSLHHVTSDIWSTWGPFDSSFAVARNPLSRFISAYTYRYVTSIAQSKVEHSPAVLEEFRGLVMPFLEKELKANLYSFDNHFRPQLDFIQPDTKLYLFEQDGCEQLMSDMGLTGALPHTKKSDFHIELNDREMAFFESFYADDICWYEELAAST